MFSPYNCLSDFCDFSHTPSLEYDVTAIHTLAMLRAGALAGATRVSLRGELSEFPREIFDLADTLEILDLSGNRLSALPDDLPRLAKLQVLFCSDNLFTELPAVLGQCTSLTMIGFKANRINNVPAASLPPHLRWLILTDNEIAELPAELGQCTDMQKLMLAGNRLRVLPASLAGLHKLELLRISANALEALPEWIYTLPRLAWLACAGNPFTAQREAEALDDHESSSITWNALTLHEQLGEGASGVIHRGVLAADEGGAPRDVAVKLFKGAVTSDGLPGSEMAACIAAGVHPGLISILGKVLGHPGGVNGLVMPLIDPAFGNLAGPPSLSSCSRDVYRSGTPLLLAEALGMAYTVASAAAHLHARGVLHGDLYGHNILYAPGGKALLGDFGAASLHVPGTPQALALERIEVRSFGILLDELLAFSEPPAGPSPLVERMATLAHSCCDEEMTRRPTFQQVAQQLVAAAV